MGQKDSAMTREWIDPVEHCDAAAARGDAVPPITIVVTRHRLSEPQVVTEAEAEELFKPRSFEVEVNWTRDT